MKAICVSGSPSATAGSHRLLTSVIEALTERGWEIDLIRLREFPLPPLDVPAYYVDPYPDAAVQQWRSRVGAADAVVLATSVHHASFSGLLKYALDFLTADAFVNKPVTLLANGGAARGATIGCEHLRTVVKALGGWAGPTQIASSPQDFDAETGELSNKALLRRCQSVAEELTMFTRAFRGAAATV